MEEFSRVDIFDTKGIEYLFVIGYLLILIVFWNMVKNPGKMLRQIRDTVSTISANVLRVPKGIFFNRFHTWTHLDESGAARVGMDDFLQHVAGDVKFTGLKNPGEIIQKGEMMTRIDQRGKQLKVFSPISGEIIKTNFNLIEEPGIINKDPYRKGWIYKVQPSNWVKETNSYLLAEEATDWSVREVERFKDFLTVGAMRKFSEEPSMVLLQDGGEIRENILSDLPVEVWTDFQEEFLNFTGAKE